MAEANYIRLSCLECNQIFEKPAIQGRGKPRTRCFDCSPIVTKKYVRGEMLTRVCSASDCTNTYESTNAQRLYCCASCRERHTNREGHKRRYQPSVKGTAGLRNPAHTFVCLHCGKENHRRPSGSSRAKGYVNKYCSHVCRSANSAPEREAKAKARQIELEQKRLSRPIKLTKAQLAAAIVYVCVDCGIFTGKPRGQNPPRCLPCKALFRKLKKRSAPDKERTPAERAARSKARAKRRSLERAAAVETIDPFSVFEMDIWCCRMCGVFTPPQKRGKYDPNAPELDHIVSLADGGQHVRSNLQLTCRRCNLLKGAGSLSAALAKLKNLPDYLRHW